MTNEPAERLRESVAARIANLNPGQGGTAQRRKGNIAWCRIHLEQTLAEAEDALAAERRATVEWIRAAMHDPALVPVSITMLHRIDAILDAEAQR